MNARQRDQARQLTSEILAELRIGFQAEPLMDTPKELKTVTVKCPACHTRKLVPEYANPEQYCEHCETVYCPAILRHA